MKRFTEIFLLVVVMGFSALAAAKGEPCPPQPPWTQPEIPDGELATDTQMQQAQAGIVAYVRGIEHWSSCNDYVHGLQSGRMVGRAREFADSYNEELRKYLARDLNSSGISQR
ncbi:MAG: hypothetical protein V7746_22065 [Halioglobus sp.]